MAMKARKLERFRRRLYSRVPLIGGWLRQRAAEALARDGSSGAMRALAKALARSDDEGVRGIALQTLRELTGWRGISAACGVWADTRHPSLTALLTEREWVASTPPEVKVLTALKVGRLDVVTDGDAKVIEPLVQACDDADPTIAERARGALLELKNEEAQEALCRFLVERDHPVAREAALAARYLPQDEGQRALFFFTTEQWERYDGLDFDRQLLRTAYALADDALRGRIRQKLRAAGRTDFLTVVAGEDYRARAAEMNTGELDLLIQTLAANREWAILWQLVFEVPFIWSARVVRTLADSGWQPEIEDDRPLFEDLTSLAEQDLPISEEEIKRFFPPALMQAQARVPGRINDVAFSPARPVIAIGTGQRKVALWNYQRAERERLLGGFDHSIGHVTFTGDNLLLCAERTNASEVPCAIFAWRDAWKDDQSFRLGHHNGSVTALAPVGGSQVLSTGRDHEVILWDVYTKGQVARRHLYSWAREACVSPDGQQVALLRRGLDLVTLPQLDQLAGLGASRSVIRCAAFFPDGEALIVGKFNGDVVVYERKRKDWLAREKGALTRHEGRVEGVEVLRSRSVVVTAGSEGRIQFTALKNRAAIGSVQVPFGRVTSLHVSPNESFMAVGNSRASLSLWDLRLLDVRRLLMQPFARAAATLLPILGLLVEDENLRPRARLALKFAQSVLRHRARFDIEIEEAPTIMRGEFDIEIE